MSSGGDGDAGGHAGAHLQPAANPTAAADSSAGFDSTGDASVSNAPPEVDPMDVEDEELADIRAAELLLRQSSRASNFNWKNIGSSMAAQPANPDPPAKEEPPESAGGGASEMQPASAEPNAEESPATKQTEETSPAAAAASESVAASENLVPSDIPAHPKSDSPVPAGAEIQDASAADVSMTDADAEPTSGRGMEQDVESVPSAAAPTGVSSVEASDSPVVEDEKTEAPSERRQATEDAPENAEGTAVVQDQAAEPTPPPEAITTSTADQASEEDQPDHAGRKRQRSGELAEPETERDSSPTRQKPRGSASPATGSPRGEEKGEENGASALAPAAEEQEAEQTAGDDEMPVDALAEQAQAQLEPADSSPAAVDPNPPSGESESAAEPSMSAPPNAAVEPAVEPASATVSASDQPSTQDTEMPAEEPVAPPLAAEASQSSEGDSAQAPAAKEEDTAPAAEGPDASGASEQAPQQQPELSAAPGVSMYAEEDGVPSTAPAASSSSSAPAADQPAAAPPAQGQILEPTSAATPAKPIADPSAAFAPSPSVSATPGGAPTPAPPATPGIAAAADPSLAAAATPGVGAAAPPATPSVAATPGVAATPSVAATPGSVATPAGPGTPAEAESGMRGAGRGLPKGFRKSKIDDSGKFHFIAPDGTICQTRKEVKQWDEANALEEGRFVEEVFEPPEDRAKFLSFVVLYLRKEKKHVEANAVVEKMSDIAQIDGKAVDFSDLFHRVRARGGSSRMNRRIWISVLQEMNLSNGSAEANAIKNLYERYLRCCEEKNWDPKELEKAGESTKQIERGTMNLLDLLESGVLQAGQELVYNKKDEDTKQILNSHVGFLNPDGTIQMGRKKFKNPNKFVLSFNDGSEKTKKKDGWKEVFVGEKSLAQIKNAFAKNLNQTAKQGLLQPEKAFGSTLLLLQTQSEQDATQIREAERAAMNPPPKWISPEDDADSAQRGKGAVHADLEAALAKLETAGPEELQSTMKKMLDAVKDRQAWTEAIASSPDPLTRIARCWWRWFFKSSLPPPYGSWTLDKGLVPALSEELNPTRKRKKQKSGAHASGITLANSKYTASNLPPGWRKELRNVVMGFYNYISPDGQYFRNWAKAFEYHILTAKDEPEDKPAAAEDQPQEDAAKTGSVAGAEALAEGKEAGEKGGAKGDEGASVEGGEAAKAAEEDVGSEKKDEMVLDEQGEDGDAAMADVEAKTEGEHAENPPESPDRQVARDGGQEEAEEGEIRMSQCTCCRVPKCEFVDYEELLGSTGLSQSRLQAPAYTIMALTFTVLLSNTCNSVNGGIERIGSHGPTLQILIESLAKDAPQPVRLTTLEVLLVIAHVVNLRIAPGNRLLGALSEALEGSSSMKRAFVELPVYIIARLAECPHNRQVLQENEASVLPTLLWLLQFPKSPSLLSAVLDTLERYSLCGPCLARRIQKTKGCVKTLVTLVGSKVDSNDSMARKITFRDRIKAARILLKIAEDPGGISSLQEHEGDLVDLLVSSNQIPPGDQGDAEELRTILGSIMHAMVPTEAPYIKALENYDPLPSSIAQ